VHENGMVRAVVKKYAEALGIEVILVGHLHGKIGAGQVWGRDQGQEETSYDSREHRLGMNAAPLLQHDMTCTPTGRRVFPSRGGFLSWVRCGKHPNADTYTFTILQALLVKSFIINAKLADVTDS